MRYLLGSIFVLALAVMGCSETSGTNGSGGIAGNGGVGGDGGTGGMTGQEFPCTEQGIRDAIAEGGGPHTFDCDGQHEEVRTGDEIVIDNNVILDGEGNLRVEGNLEHRVFVVDEGVTAELHGLTVARGGWLEPDPFEESGGCILNKGTLALTGCWVTECSVPESGNPMGLGTGGGIANFGALTMRNCTVSGNSAAEWGGGIANGGTLTMTNCTVSGNGNAISSVHEATATITNSTVSENEGVAIFKVGGPGTLTLANSVVDGGCQVTDPDIDTISFGYNIESPGDTCGFGGEGDRVNVSAEELNLGPLARNGGPTLTHEPKTIPVVSVAIDQIPEADCEATTDQRGVDRPQGSACDIGAVEWRHCESAEDCDDNYDCTDDVCDPATGICEHNDWCI